ncbi:Utp21 specific WD40 associated domain containing protein [Aphelenchoides avenae]|nr:Utp21 specific WD40 associated domain containing protein [Aphelenchus avenae]
MQRHETNLLAPYKALGQVCSGIPPAYLPLPQTKTYGEVCCAVENVVCLYTMTPLRLQWITSPMLDVVTVVARDRTRIYAAVGSNIAVIKRNRMVERWIQVAEAPKFIMPFGDALIVIDEQNTVRTFDIESGEEILEVESPGSCRVSALVHPSTYINKIVLGCEDGRLRILNVKTGKLVHEFLPDATYNSKITVLEQSPAIDVLAVGLESGYIHLRNVKLDRTIASFKQDASISSVAFRTDGADVMLSANSEGSIAVWDLNEQMLIGQKTHAHSGPVVSMHCMLGQPFVITSGTDNRMVKWVLKNELALPEVHTELEGHAEPVTCVKFYNELSVLSAGLDGCVRRFALFRADIMRRIGLAREVKKSELSKDRFIDVRMEPIVQMDVGWAREAVWDNVICRHRNSPVVSTWSTRRQTKGEHLLYHKRFKYNPAYLNAYASSLCLSACGNFAIIGYSSGHLDVFNMQSGVYKLSYYYSKISKLENEDDRFAHSGAVSGVVSDLVNRTVVSGSTDGSVHFWTTNPPRLVARVPVAKGIAGLKLDRNNSLLAVATVNGGISIVDVLSRTMARQIASASSDARVNITAMEFSADGKWLVWDIATNSLIDVMRCWAPCLGLSFNDTGEYLATCHEGQRAVYLWANKALFMSEFSVRTVTDETPIPVAQQPSASGDEAFEAAANGEVYVDSDSEDDDDVTQRRNVVIDDESDEDTAMEAENADVDANKQIDPSLVTLSGLPATRWANLPDLQAIRERNKPLEPPKKPEAAPFFLPTVGTLDGFSFEKEDANTLDEATARREKALMAKRRILELTTPWAKTLLASTDSDDAEKIKVFNSLKDMNVSSIDFQVRSLPAEALHSFVDMLAAVLKTRNDFELAVSYLATFLKIHREHLWKAESLSDDDTDSLTKKLHEVLQIQDSVWSEVQQSIEESTSVTQWVKSAVL